VDGVFNSETRATIRRFQRQHSLVVDGHVGPVTERELILAGAAQPPTEMTSELAEETPHISLSPLTHISCPAPLVAPTGTPGAPPDILNLIRIVSGVLSGLPLGTLGIKLPTAARFLDATEQSEAVTIYGSSLDFTKIVITDGLGASSRPFTVAVPLASGFHIAMNLGDLCSWASRPRSDTLVHELAHAWQSQHHGSSPTAYMSNSVACQLLAMADLPIAKAAAAKNATTAAVKHGVFDTSRLATIAAAAAAAEDVSAYAYIPGKAFDEYAAEQIAQQVEHTYSHSGHPTPGVVTLISSVKPHVVSPENERGLTVRSFHRKSTAGVVFA
jgi:hypothetical protein